MKRLIIAAIHPEKWYQDRFCQVSSAYGGSPTTDGPHVWGQKEKILSDRTRVDCLTKTYAYELDFAKKWAEAVGQSIYYAEKTGRQPAIVLIVETLDDIRYVERLTTVINRIEGGIKLIVIQPNLYE